MALRGPLNAAAIARGLPDVPMNQLSERLARLESRDLVSVRDGEAGARLYALTDAGRAVEDVLGALARFGLAHTDAEADPGETVLPHVLMAQLELRFDAARAAAEGFAGRFDLEIADPGEMWSVEPGAPAPGRFALLAGPEGLRCRAGACLDADARLTATVDTCAGLVAANPQAALEVEITGDSALAERLLDLLSGAPASRIARAA